MLLLYIQLNNITSRKAWGFTGFIFLRKGKEITMIKEKEITIFEEDYLNDLKQIKQTIKTNQNKAMVVVNSAMILTYYEIGTIINQRKIWGNKYIERLSNDLKGYGSGYSYDNLNYMRKSTNLVD